MKAPWTLVSTIRRYFLKLTSRVTAVSRAGYILGAEWGRDSADAELTLQIWRPVSGVIGSYTIVGSTRIEAEEESTGIYHYPLSSPLPFQAGDVLGYHQPSESNSQLILLFEEDGVRGHQLAYYYSSSTPDSDITISGSGNSDFQVFVNVVTGKC